MLAPYLTYKRRLQQGGDAKDAIYQTRQLYRILEHDTLMTHAGFATRIMHVFKGLGISVKYEDYNKSTLGEPDYANLDPLRELQPEVIASIIANDLGVIEAPTGAGKSFLIRQICKLWPKARILICSPISSVIRQTYAELREALRLDEVGQVGDGKCETKCRVTCVVDKSLMKCDLDKVDIFIYDEVHRAAAKQGAIAISKIHKARRYGFSACPHGRSDGADIETEGLFGPVICKLTYQEVQKTGSIVPIEVRVHSTATVPPVAAMSTTVLERHGYWRNEARNKIIAESVKDVIKELGEQAQVLISVETLDHAIHLSQFLPEFTLVYVSMDATRRVSWEKAGLIKKGEHPITADQREEMRVAFHKGELKRAIATGTWGTGVDFPHLNVLVRADGQAGTIPNTQIPGRVTRTAGGKDLGIVLDYDDIFNQTLAGRAERRFAAYKKKGWELIRLAPNVGYLNQ